VCLGTVLLKDEEIAIVWCEETVVNCCCVNGHFVL